GNWGVGGGGEDGVGEKRDGPAELRGEWDRIRVGRVIGGVAAAETLGGDGEHTVVAGADGDRCRVPAGGHVAVAVPPRGALVEHSHGVVARERHVGAGGPVVRDRVRG